jgi:hypothetical protein
VCPECGLILYKDDSPGSGQYVPVNCKYFFKCSCSDKIRHISEADVMWWHPLGPPKVGSGIMIPMGKDSEVLKINIDDVPEWVPGP